MKKILILLLTILSLTACTPNQKIITNSLEGDILDNVDYQISNMTLEEKIAQMLIISSPENEVDESLEETIKNVKPGGFILTADNFSTYEQTLTLVKNLQKLSDLPMIIAIDQEGGKVQRLNNLTDLKPTSLPAMYYLGKMNDENLAYEVGKLMATEMRTLGINVVFAPVLDIYSNPDNEVIGTRSFGHNSAIVSQIAISLGKGLNDGKVVPTYKHFPGHGDTSVDSHQSLPIIDKSLEELYKEELIPFKTAIENQAEIIMIGHLALPQITGSNLPSSLSKEIITNLLRKDLGYTGLVISDALNMKALTDNYSSEEIYELAINAGTDLLLMPDSPANALKIIKEKVETGLIKEDTINESVKRILTFKDQHLKDYEYLDSSYLGKQEHKDIIDQIIVSEDS